MIVAHPARGLRMPRSARNTARLAAVVALIGTALAACGSSSADGGSTITVSHGYTAVEATELQALATQWNDAHPSTKVNLVFNGGNDSALQKTVAGFTAGNYPDVAYFPPSCRPVRSGTTTCRRGRTRPSAHWLVNSTVVSATCVVSHLVLCSLAGYAFARLRSPAAESCSSRSWRP